MGQVHGVTDSLAVSEVFKSLQGEGPNAGRPTTFLRLMGCNLKCSWCDTAYTWDASRFDLRSETTIWEVEDLARNLDGLLGEWGLLDITGGEPLLQENRLITMLHRLRTRPQVEVETNGTLVPGAGLAMRVHRFNVSPKLAHSGNFGERYELEALKQFAYMANSYGQALFKFVIDGPEDLIEVKDIVASSGIEDRHVWLMPLGNISEAIQSRLPWVADAALANGWNCTARLHVNAFYDARGR